ncbi:LysM domain-containing protein [Streptomyces sp. yr375]|uniref:LysM peptidoglycan-binding domain-containing protein n=1 Tax=Streptomyces sp. yr375 TaxID=1761906 RepID=UPI0008C62556|nr:transglycosylase family protein [Streptomyces sp. yr375]SER75639.1 LysM domain-containing protein [Streptomyces sp. yr375]
MLSGNGRHRRPRQAPALLVAAGVTGSAIAIPLLAASGASAADGTVWDKVAQCETGGSWSAHKGDGEYGGLSLTQKQWETYDGLDYAASPDLASRNQQIAVAQKLLAAENIGAWGTCGLTSGLTQQNGALNVDTGVADDSSESSISNGLSDLSKGSSDSSDSSGSSESSGSSSSSDSSDSSDSSKSSEAGDSSTDSPGSPDSSDDASSSPSKSPSSSTPPSPSSSSSSPGKGDAQGSDSSSTGSANKDDSDKSLQDVGSWSLVDTGSLGAGRHRGDAADATADVADAADVAPASTGRHAAAAYVVQAGDSLASIADSLGLDGGWRALYAENRDLIGADPSDIVPGQTLDTGVE